jgi:hypothetical protein
MTFLTPDFLNMQATELRERAGALIGGLSNFNVTDHVLSNSGPFICICLLKISNLLNKSQRCFRHHVLNKSRRGLSPE